MGRWFKVVLIMLLLAALLTPFVELVDSWDGPLDLGNNDSEIQFLATLVWAGLALVMGKLLLLQPMLSVSRLHRLSGDDRIISLDSILEPAASASPPLPLRI